MFSEYRDDKRMEKFWYELSPKCNINPRKMRLYNTMVNYKSVSKCIMWLRDKEALVYAVLFIIFIAHVACMPEAKKTLQVLNKYSARSQNVESMYKKYNFPETEYAASFKPRTPYDLDNFERTYSIKEPSERSQNLLKLTRSKRKRKLFNNNLRKVENSIDILPHLPSVPKNDDFPHFPEVEYPLNAREIWKPTYWDNLFPSVDNGQNNKFKVASKKLFKDKNKFEFKNCPESKASDKNKSQNNTNDGICEKNTIVTNTNTPLSNNFVMKDKDSFTELRGKKDEVQSKPISRNMCELNTGQSDYKQINKSISVNNSQNATTVTDICPRDKNVASHFPSKENFEYKNGEEDVRIDEEFTTDEPDFALAFITPPPPNTDDMLWKQSKIIEPYKSLSYPDELDDYFIAVNN